MRWIKVASLFTWGVNKNVRKRTHCFKQTWLCVRHCHWHDKQVTAAGFFRKALGNILIHFHFREGLGLRKWLREMLVLSLSPFLRWNFGTGQSQLLWFPGPLDCPRHLSRSGILSCHFLLRSQRAFSCCCSRAAVLADPFKSCVLSWRELFRSITAWELERKGCEARRYLVIPSGIW